MLPPFKPSVTISLPITKKYGLVPYSSCGDKFQSIILPVPPADSLQWSILSTLNLMSLWTRYNKVNVCLA